MTTPPPAAAQSVSSALARLWTRFLPEFEQRVAILDAAAQALTAGSLTNEQREAAHAAAHKLAGTLGMFGLREGTELARRVELMLAGDSSPMSGQEFTACVERIRCLLQEDR